MEAFGVLFALALLAIVIILPIWLVLTVVSIRRRAESDRQQSTQHWQDLTTRVHLLETHIKQLKQVAAGPPEASHETRESKPAAPAAVAPAAPTPPPMRPVPPTGVPLGSVPPLPAKAPVNIPRPEPARPAAPAILVIPATLPLRQAPTPTPPSSHARSSAKEPVRRSGLDLEEMLGTNWLKKIGIGILVLGLAFFLAYQLQNLGPAGKVFLGVGLSAAMIAVGVRYESNERYRILA